MCTSENRAETPSDDPCHSCENLERRNIFLAEHCQSDFDKTEGCRVEQLFTHNEQDLGESLRRFKRLAEAAFEGIIIHDLEQNIIDVNPQFIDMYGYTLDELTHTPLLDLVAPQSRDTVSEKIASGFKDVYQTFAVKKDGTVFPVLVNVKEALLDNRPVRIVSTYNMTEQLQQQQQLKAVFESSQDDIIVLDKNYTHLYINTVALERFHLTSEQAGVGKTIYDALGHRPDFLNLWIDRIDEVFRTEKPMRVQDDTLSGDLGFYRESILSPIRYQDGEVFAVSIVARDMTEEKMLKKQLAQNERQYRELYSNSPACLSRIRISDGKAIACSQATISLFGYTDAEQFMEQFSTQTMYVDPQRKEQLMAALHQDKRVEDFQAQVKRKDGTPFWISITAEIFPEKDYIEEVMAEITSTKTLSKAEKKVLKYLMEGMSNKQIARKLERSVRTIEDHRSHIMQKMDVDNLVELTQKTLNLPSYHQQ